MKTWKIAGISFDHMHMGDNLRMVFEHPSAEIVAVCDPRRERIEPAAKAFDLPEEALYTDYRTCLDEVHPDIVLLCPAAARHGLWVERVAPYGVHVMIEKPFAASLAEADRVTRAMRDSGKRLAINWPLAWYPTHVTTKRLIDEGRIGDVLEVHYYDGNRGPLWHVADKVQTDAETVAREKPDSWFYKQAQGGGSLLDYLGYGATLATWFNNGQVPLELTTIVDDPVGLEVDEHSVTVARYERGLSKFETRWGTFSDPWTHQPQPKCGFVLVGSEGTISSYDFQPSVRLQSTDCPQGEDILVDELQSPHRNPVEYLIDCIENDRPIEGPLSPQISRIGQQIVDAAVLSSKEKRTVLISELE